MLRLVGVLLILAFKCMACSCGQPLPACHAFGTAPAVFTGTVLQIGYDSSRGRSMYRITFQVVEVFKGSLRDKVDVMTGIGQGDCGIKFTPNATYLVYAYRGDGHPLEANMCGRTRLVEDSAGDLSELRELKDGGVEGRAIGYVSRQMPRRREPYRGEGAIAGVDVWLVSGTARTKATTDAKGEYSFNNLPPGEYELSTDLPGKLAGGEPQGITVPARACTYSEIIARNGASVRGVVRNAEGVPVVGIRIDLLNIDKQTESNYDYTRLNGEYRISDVAPGQYLLGISLLQPPYRTQWTSMPYRRGYYPGNSDAATAVPISVEAAQEII